ncbi:MAG: hypothetical protein ACTSX9_04390 [Candidatus Njordarchaeales archaeon]
MDVIKHVHTNAKKTHTEKHSTTTLLSYGSFLIDGALFRVKNPKIRRWLEKFLEKHSEELGIKVLIRTNPYKTLQILWSEYLRIALKGHNLRTFLQITNKLEELSCTSEDEHYMVKGVRVIPLAPAWVPENRVLIDLILEYLAGRIDEALAKRVFYSAFLKLFRREELVSLPQSLS